MSGLNFTIGGGPPSGPPSGSPPGGGTVVGLIRPDRDYQREAIDKVFGDWNNGSKSLLLVLPCGAGKTIVGADIIRRAVQQTSQKTLFMAHRAELLTQSRDKIHLVAPQLSVGIVQAQHDDVSRQVTVASVQTLINKTRLQRVLQHGPYSLLVIDEAHHATSPSWLDVIHNIRLQNPTIRILGLTATPGRSDGLGLSDLFEKISYTKSTLELIEEKWLVYPRAFRVNLNIDLDVIGTNSKGHDDRDLKDGDLAKLLIQQPVLDATYEAYAKYGDGRTMIGFSVNVEHARLLAETFTKNGTASAFVAGDTPAEQRHELYAKFRAGTIRVLFSCSVLTEGYDEPSAGGVLLARPTMSQSLFIQMVGRGLRPYPTKSDCIIIDCAGNTKKHAIVQMSTLAGFEQFDAMTSEKDTIPREDGEDREVIAHGTDMYGNEVRITDIRGSTRESTYSWRQTDYGYALMIPKVGYYLVANDEGDPSTATIRYYDTRKTPDGRPTPAVTITEKPIDCNLAYGLVESEAKRILRAAMRAANEKRPTSSRHPDKQLSFDDHLTKVVDNLGPLLIDGIDDESIDNHILMSRTARWREGPRTDAQTKLLAKLGTKVDNMPATAGEASDLISIASVEKHQKSVKMHGDPATPKQKWFLRTNGIPYDADISKADAAKLIFRHRMKLKSSNH